uniref:Uncharacterized protein n=1 Tax=Ignisphaera aggregans TaxID=334771 RepID=A0A7J2T9I4_9CREN
MLRKLFKNFLAYIIYWSWYSLRVIIMVITSFGREWALSWIKGSIASYLRDKAPISIVFGRIRKAIKVI